MANVAALPDALRDALPADVDLARCEITTLGAPVVITFAQHTGEMTMTIDVEKYRTLTQQPGKFEGASPETPYYWGRMLEGEGEPFYPAAEIGEEGDCYWEGAEFTLFEVDYDESQAFDLPHGSWIALWTDSQGFAMARNGATREELERAIRKYLGL